MRETRIPFIHYLNICLRLNANNLRRWVRVDCDDARRECRYDQAYRESGCEELHHAVPENAGREALVRAVAAEAIAEPGTSLLVDMHEGSVLVVVVRVLVVVERIAFFVLFGPRIVFEWFVLLRRAEHLTVFARREVNRVRSRRIAARVTERRAVVRGNRFIRNFESVRVEGVELGRSGALLLGSGVDIFRGECLLRTGQQFSVTRRLVLDRYDVPLEPFLGVFIWMRPRKPPNELRLCVVACGRGNACWRNSNQRIRLCEQNRQLQNV